MGNRIGVFAGDDLQTMINTAPHGSTLVVGGSHTGTYTIARDELTIENDGDAVIEKFLLQGTVREVILDGLALNRTTPVTGASDFAIECEATIDCLFQDLDISGHGYNEGIRFRNTYEASGCEIVRPHIYEIENRGIFLIGSNHKVIGAHIHDLYRTVDLAFNDVDVLNVHGPGHEIRGCYAHDCMAERSISTDNTGTAAPPHVDFVQSFLVFKDAGVTPWITSGLKVEDNHTHLISGQLVILESDKRDYVSIISPQIRRNRFYASKSNQLMNFKGTQSVVAEDNVLGMIDVVGGSGSRFIYFREGALNGGTGSYTENVDPLLAGNLFVGPANAPLWQDPDSSLSGLVEYRNDHLKGDMTDAVVTYPELARV